jgi:hypothetical protein
MTWLAGPTKDIRKRKYQEDFIKFVFTSTVGNGEERLQCVICCEVLANESLNANKLMKHLKIKHGSLADQGAEFFKRKAETVNKTNLIVVDLTSKKNAATEEASFVVAQSFTKAKNPTQFGV